MNILAIGAHFDDVELGCGGALLRWKAEGHRLFLFVASKSGYADAQGRVIRADEVAALEGRRAAEQIGAELLVGPFPTFALEFAEALNREVLNAIDVAKPDIVLSHWTQDAHHDHRALALSAIHCCRHVPRLLMYRSNWYDTGARFHPCFSVDISDYLDKKVGLIALHDSEFKRTNGQWEEFVRAEARLFGLKAGCQAAESFEVVKWLY